MKRCFKKIKLHNSKDADRTAEGCIINSPNQRPQLSFPVVTVQVIKYTLTFRKNHRSRLLHHVREVWELLVVPSFLIR